MIVRIVRKQNELDSYDAILDSLKRKYKLLKLQAPRRPKAEGGKKLNPSLPFDITAISDERLGRLHGEFAAMSQYALFWASYAAVKHAIVRREDRLMRARVRMTVTGSQADKSAKVEISSRVQKLARRMLIVEGVEVLAKATLDGYIIGRDATSREITRRTTLRYGRNE